jgi:hypothetical protein
LPRGSLFTTSRTYFCQRRRYQNWLFNISCYKRRDDCVFIFFCVAFFLQFLLHFIPNLLLFSSTVTLIRRSAVLTLILSCILFFPSSLFLSSSYLPYGLWSFVSFRLYFVPFPVFVFLLVLFIFLSSPVVLFPSFLFLSSSCFPYSISSFVSFHFYSYLFLFSLFLFAPSPPSHPCWSSVEG